jgi:dienelactone hydrolase
LFTSKGRVSARERDWADRFVVAGYVVLLPDSFGSRGLGPQCKNRDRDIGPRGRVGDAVGAADWLASQPFVDPQRIALVGWSNGGSTVLWTVSGSLKPAAHDWRVAIAFYPGCRTPSENRGWKPRVVPNVLIGAADDWTPPAPCRVLKERGDVKLSNMPAPTTASTHPIAGCACARDWRSRATAMARRMSARILKRAPQPSMM